LTIVINEFDGFRVEVDNENNRGDIILSRPPLNVIQYSQRIQMAEAMKDLDKNENVRVIILRADGKNFSSGGNIEVFLQ
jgi:2-oxoglutaroyl-CoA hydrolase